MTPTELELAISAARDAWWDTAEHLAYMICSDCEPDDPMLNPLREEVRKLRAKLERLIALRTAPNPAQKGMAWE